MVYPIEHFRGALLDPVKGESSQNSVREGLQLSEFNVALAPRRMLENRCWAIRESRSRKLSSTPCFDDSKKPLLLARFGLCFGQQKHL